MKTLRTPEELRDAGLIAPERAAALADVAARYAVAIPPALAALIDRNDPNDPIARQFVPDVAELDVQRQENADPIGDAAHSPVEGIVHRYPDRVLFKLTHVCAVYCRFCFRREMVGPNHPNALSAEARARALAYIAAHPKIWEVILTGGDPLVASARRLSETLRALAAIDHVKVLRIHTRVPIAAPETITPALVRALKVKGKLLTRLKEDGDSLLIKGVGPEERDTLCEAFPDLYYFTDHYRDYPMVLIRLSRADAETVISMLERTYRALLPKSYRQTIDSSKAR